MASSNIITSSNCLTNLKSELQKLSEALHELSDLMDLDSSQLGNTWRDGKYEEFIAGYKPQIAKCEEISQRYLTWCKQVLDPAIEEAIDIETTDVGGDGASGSVSTGSVSSDSTSEGAAAPTSNKFGFNTGKKKSESFKDATHKVQEMGEDARKKEAAAIAWAKKSGDSGSDIPGTDRTTRPAVNMNFLLNGRGGR